MIVLAKQESNIEEFATKAIRYDIVDRHTGKVVGSSKTRARASRSADKRDLEYGAYRYSVKAIYE